MYIGIDLGTSSVKLILADRAGNIVRSISRSFELIFPQPSWTEQDPVTWYDRTIDGLRRLIIGYENEIDGIGFSGQMHGLVLLDENDRVLRNAILWNDQRTVKEVAYLNDVVGVDSLIDATGNIALTGLTAPKLLWVRNHEPEIFRRIHKVMLPKDYLSYRLSGSFTSDVSDLSGTLFFDPETKTYSKKMLALLGLDESMLPRICESHEVVGTLTPQLQTLLHLKREVKIVIGGGDQAIGAVGVGVISDGDCSISLGTSGVIFVASDSFAVDRISHFQSYAHANGKYHVMAVMLNAAGALKWWNEEIFASDDYEAFFRRVAAAESKDNLFFLPYLTGERAPINDPYAKGVLYGLGIHHTRNDLDRAIVEGVTFALKDSFELIKKLGVKIARVRLTGGGAKSRFWAQLIADAFDVETVKMKSEEGPAFGAAILAMVGCGEFADVKAACEKLIQVDESFVPNPTAVRYLQSKYQQFTKIYPSMKKLFQETNS